PDFFYRFHVIGTELAHVAVRTGHLIKRSRRSAAIAVAFEVRRCRHHGLARLHERRNEQTGRGVITCRRPVVAAGARGARVHGFVRRFVDDVITIGWLSGLWIELCPDVLEYGFFVTEILTGFPIELPQDAVFPNREQPIL